MFDTTRGELEKLQRYWIPSRVRILRTRLEMTQTELGEALGLARPKQSIYEMEHGKYPVSLLTAILLFNLLDRWSRHAEKPKADVPRKRGRKKASSD